MKKILYLAIIVFILQSCGRKSYEEQIAEQAADFTQKQCPRNVDIYTTIDSMTFDIEKRTIHYFYTLNDKLDDPSVFTESNMEDFRERLLVKLREDINLKKEKEAELGFCYHYRSNKTGKDLLSIEFTPNDYNGKLVLKSFNYRMVRNSREYTRLNCPVRQDEFTLLDSLWYDSISRKRYYDYSLSGDLDNDSLFEDPVIKARFKQKLVQSLKEDSTIIEERDKEHIDFSFRYFSSTSKKMLFEVTVNNDILTK